MKKFKNLVKKIQTPLWIGILIILWEISARLGWLNEYLMPAFSKVISAFFIQVVDGKLGLQILNSLGLVLVGFAISFVLAIIISVLCVYLKPFESLTTALCTIMNPLPGMAVLPLIMMWFGVDTKAMFMLIVHGVLWPLVTNLNIGFKSIPVLYKEWGSNIGLKPIRMFTDIYLGAVMPYVITGLRVGWGRAWRALISAEMVFGMIGSLGGVGYYIYQNRAYANSTNVLVGVLAIVIIGVFMEEVVFRLIERNTIDKWGEN